MGLGGAMLAMVVAQSAPTTTTPRWSLQVGQTQCFLERRNVDEHSTFSVDTTPGSDSYRVALSTPDMRLAKNFTPASLILLPSQTVVKGFASTTKLTPDKSIIWMDGLPPIVTNALLKTEAITISAKTDTIGPVGIAGAEKAIEAFRNCSAQQLIDWGAEPAQFAPGGKIPIALKSRDDWLTTNELLAIGRASGSADVNVVFRVAISTSGAVDDCQIVSGTKNETIKQIACAAVMNKRLFTPATDAAGKPVRGVATFRVMLMTRSA